MTTHHRPYQGFPYNNPFVIDAPSISATTAARWTNLPRRQVELPTTRQQQRSPEPEVYIQMESTAYADPRTDFAGGASLSKKADSAASPVVYIDLPDASASPVVESRQHSFEQVRSPSTHRQENKRDPGDDPVVYIDLPEASGSDVAQSPQNEEPEFLQDTIFFDPFENRRIETKEEQLQRRTQESESEDDTVSTISGYSNRPRQFPAARPNTLDLFGAGFSGASSSNAASSSATPALPPIMSKESLIYGQLNTDNADGFPMSPIPVSEFPEPPPAYTEFQVEPVTEQPRPADDAPPPRTQVILPTDQASPTIALGIPNPDRKYLGCHHCGMRVHTLVVKENGTITHVMGLTCLLTGMLPIVALIYCTDWLKVKNHYCPHCNKIIGYELPLCGNKINYVN